MSTTNRDNFEGGPQSGFKAGLAALRNEGSIPENIDDIIGGSRMRDRSPQTRTPAVPQSDKGSLQQMMDDLAIQEAEEKSKAQGVEDESQVDEDQQLEVGSETTEEGEGTESVTELPETETIKANGKDLTITWSDRDAIKQALSRSVMAREYKRDKDTALNNLSEEKKSHEESRTKITEQADTLTQIEKAKSLGPEAVIKLLFNRDFSDLMSEWEERSDWSDEKKAAFNQEQRSKQLELEIATMKQTAADDKASAQLERETAQATRVQTQFDSSYLKFNFDEVFGDSELEDDLNSRLFEKVSRKFNGKEATEVDFAEIETAFKEERWRLLKLYSKGAKKQTEDIIASHKDTAISTAQRSLQSRAKKPSVVAQAKQAMERPGGWKKLLQNRDLLKQY